MLWLIDSTMRRKLRTKKLWEAHDKKSREKLRKTLKMTIRKYMEYFELTKDLAQNQMQ